MEEAKFEGFTVSLSKKNGQITFKISATIPEHLFDASKIGVSMTHTLAELQKKLGGFEV